MRRYLAAAIAAGLALSACAAPVERTSPEGDPTPKPARSSGASVRLSKPANESTLPAGDVELAALVERFRVVDRQFQPPVEGEGHVHFYLDVDELPTTHVRPGTVEYRSVSRTTYTWPDVPPGEHTFSVQLVGNDHVPLDPAAKDEVKVTVE